MNAGRTPKKGDPVAKTNIAQAVRELISETVTNLGYRLWDVEFVKEGADRHLVVTIDSDTGIDVNACETVHRAIDPLLDEADLIDTAYYLDVSSPGIERDLRTDEQILACLGEKCEARLFAPKDGVKVLRGLLVRYEDGVITLDTGAGETTLERSEVSKLRTVYFD